MSQDLAALLEARAALDRAIRAAGGEEDQLRVHVVPPRRGRDRGCWVLRVYGPEIPRFGRRELTPVLHAAETRPAAERLARRREAELGGSGLTLGQVYEGWLAELERSGRLARSTMRSRVTSGVWLAGSFAEDLTKIGPAELLAIREDLSAAGKISSGRQKVKHFAQAWRWGHIRELVSAPWPSLPPWTSPTGDKTRKRAYTEREIADLLAHLSTASGGRYLSMAWLMVETAARSGAVRSLLVRNVEVAADGSATIRIGRDGRTKGNRERHSLISPELVAALDLDRPPEAPLFPSRRDPSRPVGKNTLWKIVSAWLKSRGLFGLRDVHSIRRRGVAHLHGSGIPDVIGQRITGHVSRDVYLDYASQAEFDLTEGSRRLWVAAPTPPLTANAADASCSKRLAVGS
ncbi:MAG: tyrosine-type recombinase/integrase [Planctomycetes bacterium]|nr:tyrosine-type recombinase/integrase [Planctomycetota bacterium]